MACSPLIDFNFSELSGCMPEFLKQSTLCSVPQPSMILWASATEAKGVVHSEVMGSFSVPKEFCKLAAIGGGGES